MEKIKALNAEVAKGCAEVAEEGLLDEANISHIAKHEVEPHEAEEALKGLPLHLLDQVRHGEPRIVQLGETLAGRILMVVTTHRKDKIRVVTAMTAKRRYREWYKRRKETEHGGEKSSS